MHCDMTIGQGKVTLSRLMRDRKTRFGRWNAQVVVDSVLSHCRSAVHCTVWAAVQYDNYNTALTQYTSLIVCASVSVAAHL